MIAKSIQNCEEEDGETETEEGRIELSLLVLNLGVQCYILTVDNSMSIQHSVLKGKRGGITEMSQQAAAGRGTSATRHTVRAGHFFRGQGDPPTKGFKSRISKIANTTKQNRFSRQFTQSRKNVANYLEPTAADEGYFGRQDHEDKHRQPEDHPRRGPEGHCQE